MSTNLALDYWIGNYTILIIIVNIACACVIGEVASSKGHSGLAWTFGALIFGIFALLAAIGLGDRKMHILMRESVRLQQGELEDASLDRELKDAGFKPKTRADEKRDTKQAVVMFGAIVAAVLALVVLFN